MASSAHLPVVGVESGESEPCAVLASYLQEDGAPLVVLREDGKFVSAGKGVERQDTHFGWLS